jgi:hypothetical protein
MLKRRRRWDYGPALGLTTAAVILVLAVLVGFGPARPRPETQACAGTPAEVRDCEAANTSRWVSWNQSSDFLIKVATGMFALAAGWVALRAHDLKRQDHDLDSEGQITSRYTAAVAQLGAGEDQPDVTLGGIYALQRIAEDSPQRDLPTVVQVLGAYIRHRRPSVTRRSAGRPLATRSASRPLATTERAALDVGVRLTNGTRHRLDLNHTDFRGVNFDGADLTRVNFLHADFTEADLTSAKLTGANLTSAIFTRACLAHTDLAGAALAAAELKGAFLFRTNLTRAVVDQADLTDARFVNPNFAGVDLAGVTLTDEQRTGALGIS